jgi:hypothetical protein
MMISILISSNNFLDVYSSQNIYLICDIVDLRWFSNDFKFEKLLWSDASHSRVNKIR